MTRLVRLWEVVKKILRGFPKWFGLYLGLSGLITFNLFIMEEAFQTVMFGTWAAKDAKEWRLVKRASETMEGFRTTLIVMNNVGGWLNPFGYVAYKAYAESEREYIDSLRAQVFANAPELFAGETMTFAFTPSVTECEDGYMKLRNGALVVLTKKETPVVTGKVTIDGDNVVVDAR
jgi:hypothetical protein